MVIMLMEVIMETMELLQRPQLQLCPRIMNNPSPSQLETSTITTTLSRPSQLL